MQRGPGLTFIQNHVAIAIGKSNTKDSNHLRLIMTTWQVAYSAQHLPILVHKAVGLLDIPVRELCRFPSDIYVAPLLLRFTELVVILTVICICCILRLRGRSVLNQALKSMLSSSSVAVS